MRYHLTDNGPKVCRAVKRACPLDSDHFDSLEDAEHGFSQSFGSFSSMSLIEVKRDHLNLLGFDACLAKDLPIRVLHEVPHDRTLPEPGSIRSIDKDLPFALANDKPAGALWLSTALDSRESTEVKSTWRDWCETAEYGSFTDAFEAVFDDSALILELDENSWLNVPRIWDYDAKPYEFGSENYLPAFLAGSANSVPWQKLKEYGVSAVRVQGDYERKHFYGWDCDSIAVLDGDSIVDWKPA